MGRKVLSAAQRTWRRPEERRLFRGEAFQTFRCWRLSAFCCHSVDVSVFFKCPYGLFNIFLSSLLCKMFETFGAIWGPWRSLLGSSRTLRTSRTFGILIPSAKQQTRQAGRLADSRRAASQSATQSASLSVSHPPATLPARHPASQPAC